MFRRGLIPEYFKDRTSLKSWCTRIKLHGHMLVGHKQVGSKMLVLYNV